MLIGSNDNSLRNDLIHYSFDIKSEQEKLDLRQEKLVLRQENRELRQEIEERKMVQRLTFALWILSVVVILFSPLLFKYLNI